MLAVAALGVAACGGSEEDSAEPVSVAEAGDSPGGEKPERPQLSLEHPKGAYPIVWVRKDAEVPVHREAGGGDVVYVAKRETEWKSPTVFSVVKHVGEWAGVSTPEVRNGALGWIRLDPERLKSSWTKTDIQIDLSQRSAALRVDGKVVRSFQVTVGAPGYDTPTGRFAVTDTFRGGLNETAYGCCALALSATQPNVPSGWFGGDRIAIHGTFGPLGMAASNGCVRAANEVASMLVDRAGLGTPVFIRA
ncbi:MAG TPA: L,D-transpeptidase [Solirubrobacterales bacterium]|nr:L,D-transpeptidase [Solirubrobacterales bacterium]